MDEGEDEADIKKQEPWIGVVPVEIDESKASTGNQESFADAVVNKVWYLYSSVNCLVFTCSTLPFCFSSVISLFSVF